MPDNILYDLVRETREDVKSLSKQLNDHILLTQKQLEDAKRPQTFLSTFAVVATKIGAICGVFALIKQLWQTTGH